MMKFRCGILIWSLSLLLLHTVSCSPRLDNDWRFTGKLVDLLILDIDLPTGWELEDIGRQSIPNAESIYAIYDTTPDSFATNSLITHQITVFDEVEKAATFLDENYQIRAKLAKEVIYSTGLQQKDFLPPRQHAYTSPLANEFRTIYTPAENFAGLIGYEYEVWARYGNVVSWFIITVENEEKTGITAKQANVVPWPEVERLLKIIDERFEKAASKS